MNDKLICVICIFTLFVLFSVVDGYSMLFSRVLANMKFIFRHDLTEEQRLEIKLGNDYSFVKYIRDNTEPTSILSFPGNDDLFPKDQKHIFAKDQGGIRNKAWSYFFLYPRVLKYRGREEVDEKKVDYIVIVNNRHWGEVVDPLLNWPEYGIVPVGEK